MCYSFYVIYVYSVLVLFYRLRELQQFLYYLFLCRELKALLSMGCLRFKPRYHWWRNPGIIYDVTPEIISIYKQPITIYNRGVIIESHIYIDINTIYRMLEDEELKCRQQACVV